MLIKTFKPNLYNDKKKWELVSKVASQFIIKNIFLS